jgi:hypothetical protein
MIFAGFELLGAIPAFFDLFIPVPGGKFILL